MVSNLPVATPAAAMPGARSAGAPARRSGTCTRPRALGAALLALAAAAFTPPAPAQSATLISNVNQTPRTEFGLVDFRPSYQAFTTGSNSQGYTLTSADIVSMDAEGDELTIELCETSSGNPTSTCTALTAPGTFAAGTLTFTASPAISLSMGTTYALKMTPVTDGVSVASVNTGGEDAGGAAGWSIADNAVYNDPNTTDPTVELVITIKGTIVGAGTPIPPPPAGHSALVHNLDQAATVGHFSLSATTQNAQVFRTGANTHGYDLQSVELAFQTAISAADIGDLKAALWTLDASGHPVTEAYVLTNPAQISEVIEQFAPDGQNVHITGNMAVFTAPAGTTLAAGTAYAVVLSFDDGRAMFNTLSDTETSSFGFTIDDAGLQSTDSGANWAAHSQGRSLSLRVNGVARTVAPPPPIPPLPTGHSALVHNLDQIASDGKLNLSQNNQPAQVFRTGANTHGYDLQSVELAFRAAVSSADIGDLKAALWTLDGSGHPMTEQIVLANPGQIAGVTSQNTSDRQNVHITGNMAVFTAPAGSTLAASTPYAVVLSFDSGRNIYSTLSDAETTSAGFTLDNAGLQSTDSGANWTAQSSGYSLSLRVNGAARTTPPPAAVAPTFVSAAANGDSLAITFNEPLGAAANLANSAFGVTKGGGNDTVALSSTDAPVISGSTVTLTLAAALTAADDNVKVTYTRPTTGTNNRLVGAFGNEVASFTAQDVTNETSDAPAITSVAVTSTPTGGYYRRGDTISVTVTFDNPVTVNTAGGTPYVLVRVGVPSRTASYASGSGSAALVFSYTVAAGDEDKNGIAWPARALILNGGTIKRMHSDPARQADAVLSVASQAALAGHKVDAVAPVVRKAAIAGTTLTLTFSEPLGAAASLANSAFAVTRNAGNTAVTLSGSPAISGNTVTLTLSAALAATDTNVKVAYTKPTTGSNNKLVDARGNEVAAFTRLIPTAANNPATGTIRIAGFPRVGGTVNVPQPGNHITDADGVPANSDSSWHYQWVRVDGATETDIEGETSSGYRITAADEGKKLKVKVGFTDNLGNPESITSAAFHSRIAIRPNPPPPTQCAEPDLAGRTQVWRSTLYTDVYAVGTDLRYGYITVPGGYAVGTFRPRDLGFTVNGNDYSITEELSLSWTTGGDARLNLFLDKALAAADRQTLQLLVCDEVFNFKDAQFGGSNDNRWFDTGMDWYDHRTRELRLVVDGTPPALAATGAAVLQPDGRTLVLTYNEGLSEASVPAAAAFTVKATPAGGSEATLALAEADPDNNVVPVAVSGRTVTLTLAAPAAHNDTLTLGYTAPTGADATPLEDLAGNDAADFAARAVTNNSGIPRVSIAAVYPDATPGIADPVFRVTRSNTDADNALTVSLGFTQTDTYIGSTGSITIPAGQASAMRRFDSIYTGNTSGEVTAAVTGGADHLPALAPDDTATVQVSAPASGTVVDLAFDNANEFEVTEGDSVDVTLTLTVAAGLAAPREDLRVGLLTIEGTAALTPDADYTHVSTNTTTATAAGWQGTGPYTQVLTVPVATLQDALYEGPEQLRVGARFAAGQPLILSSDCPPAHQETGFYCTALVTITDDEAALALETLAVTSAPANGAVYLAGETLDISATFNGRVNVDTAGGAPKLTLDLGGEPRRAAWADGSGTRTLVFRYTVAAGDEDHDGIAWAADALDLDGGTIKLRHADTAQQVDAVLTHGAQGALAGHQVDARGPTADSATVSGATLVITFNETLAAAANLDNAAFGVTKGDPATTVALGTTAPAISGSTVTLTLGTATTAEDENVMVTYTRPTTGTNNRLADAAGNETATFTLEVRNLLGDTDPPVLADTDPAVLAADGETLTLTFNEPLDEASEPSPADFTLALGGQPGAVQEVAVSGSTVVLTLAAEFPARPRDTVTVSYTRGTNPVRDLAQNAAADFADQAVENRTVAAPGAPRSVSATPGNRQALLSWAEPAADGGAGITGYEYRVSADGGAAWDPDWTPVPDGPDAGTDPGDEREVTVMNLDNGVAYTFEVRAFNGTRHGAPGRASATLAADPAADPGPVRGLQALALDRGVALGWSAPLDDGNRALVRYEVRHARGSSVPAGARWTDAGLATEYTVGGLDNGVAYTFEVRALNAADRAGPARQVRATPSAAATTVAPPAPQGLRAEAGEPYVKRETDPAVRPAYVDVTLYWRVDENHYGEYEYRYAEGSRVPAATPWQRAQINGTELDWVIYGLEPGARYTFEARGVARREAAGDPPVHGPVARVALTLPRYTGRTVTLALSGTAREGEPFTLAATRSDTQGETYLLFEIRDVPGPGASVAGGPVYHRRADFAAGQSRAATTFMPRYDGVRDPARSFTVRIGEVHDQNYAIDTRRLSVAVRDHEAGLSVADASVREGPGAALAFTVRLDRAWPVDVTVDYRTREGSEGSALTAVAGQDFTAVSGTLRLPAGRRSGTVRVPVLDDAVDDDGETLTLELSNARSDGRDGLFREGKGVLIDDAEAVGTIRNADPLPAAWLARFGRAAAVQVTDLLGERFENAGHGPDQLTLGGRNVDVAVLRETLSDPSGLYKPDAAGDRRHVRGQDHITPAPAVGHDNGEVVLAPPVRDARGQGKNADSMPAPAPNVSNVGGDPNVRGQGKNAGGMPAPAPSADGHAGPAAQPAQTREATALERAVWTLLHNRGRVQFDARQFLAQSRFNLSLTTADADPDGSVETVPAAPAHQGRWSLWGRGALTRFSGQDGGLNLSGDVLTGLVGLDYARERWLAGAALAWHDGDGTYQAGPAGSGALDSTLITVNPYLRYAVNERLSAWGTLGYGAGTLQLRQDGRGRSNMSDDILTPTPGIGDAIETDLRLAMGAAGLRGVLYAGVATQLAVKTDALWVRTASEATDGMQGASADAGRLRLLLSGRHRRVLPNAALLSPSVELGVRYDEGDAETGFGMELGGGLRYADAALGLSVETKARALIAHEDGGYEEWGLSGSVSLDPGRLGRGLTLNLSSGWGVAESNAQAMWQRQSTAGIAPQQAMAAQARFAAEAGYGLDVPWTHGVLTPYTGLEWAGPSRTLRLGWRFTLGQALRLSLDGERREDGFIRPQHALMLRTSLPW